MLLDIATVAFKKQFKLIYVTVDCKPLKFLFPLLSNYWNIPRELQMRAWITGLYWILAIIRFWAESKLFLLLHFEILMELKTNNEKICEFWQFFFQFLTFINCEPCTAVCK